MSKHPFYVNSPFKHPSRKISRDCGEAMPRKAIPNGQQTVGCSTSLIVRECKLKQGDIPLCLSDGKALGRAITPTAGGERGAGTVIYCQWTCALLQLFWKAVWQYLLN